MGFLKDMMRNAMGAGGHHGRCGYGRSGHHGNDGGYCYDNAPASGPACADCRAALPAGARFCPQCGAGVGARICAGCAAPLAQGAQFCAACGRRSA
jgi:RNA polymerase subunit RPABC4/transcription elongation factor Spt4